MAADTETVKRGAKEEAKMKEAARGDDVGDAEDASSFVIPKEYVCPISMELMVDPVVAQDGLTYERESIARWFSTGKTRSPVTNAELPDQTLIQNHAVRGMIEAYRGKVGDSMTKFIRGLAHSEAARARELARSPQAAREALQDYLDAGADPNRRDPKTGLSPLMEVVSKSSSLPSSLTVSLAKVLLAGGADVLLRNDKGETAESLATARLTSMDGVDGQMDGLVRLLRSRAATQAKEKHQKEKQRKAEAQTFRNEQQQQRRRRAAHNGAVGGGGPFGQWQWGPGGGIGGGVGGGMQFSAGVGFFPSLFGLTFSFGPNTFGGNNGSNGVNGNAPTAQVGPEAAAMIAQENRLANLLFMLGSLAIFVLFFY